MQFTKSEAYVRVRKPLFLIALPSTGVLPLLILSTTTLLILSTTTLLILSTTTLLILSEVEGSLARPEIPRQARDEVEIARDEVEIARDVGRSFRL
jgi:hypothetical protein